jgi:hypothetical protein
LVGDLGGSGAADDGEAELEDLAKRALVLDDAEALGDDRCRSGRRQPAYDGTTRSRASRDELRQLGPPIGREPFRPAVLQPVWAG